MEAIIALALAAIEDLLPLISGATSGNVQNIINFLEKIIPEVASFAPAIITSVTNIITQLQTSGVVTADQVTQLDAMATAMEKALDAAAAGDGLSGVPSA